MTWLLVLWTVAIIILAISVSGSQTCQSVDGVAQVCSGGLDAGKALGLWAGGFAILGLIWFMTKPRVRLCPACGEDVAKGPTQCPKCGFDFAAAAAGPAGGSGSV
jgi:hypothetical protein